MRILPDIGAEISDLQMPEMRSNGADGKRGRVMTYTEKELNQFLHGISLSLLSKKSAQHWRYDEETAKEIEWLEALERKVRADKADRKTEPQTIRCPKCGRTDYIRDMKKDMGVKGSHYKYKCINCNTYIKDEPTISKMEQVDEPQTERSE